MTVLEVLKAARERVARGWTQHAHARLSTGQPTRSNDSAAASWCAVGALGDGHDDSIETCATCAAETRLVIAAGAERFGLVGWNDASGRTQEEVLQAFDKAIQREEQRAPEAQ